MTVTEQTRAKTPWHLWAIGIVTVLWNALGAFDYVMTTSKNAAYLSQFSPEQLAYFESFPFYAMISWGVAVLASVIGSALLLLRSRHAVPVFGLSLIAIAITTVHNWVIDYANAIKVMSTFGLAFSAVIIAIAIALYAYAKRQVAAGVLR